MYNIISFKTLFGWLKLIENDNKIISISFGRSSRESSSKVLKKLKKEIQSYLSGKKINSKLKLKMVGSSLQIKIWKEIQKIPFGKTKSYGEIAKKLNTSPRYVGNICGKNKHLLVVPCHRVIRSDGKLGGFSGIGGIKLKKKLLNLEKIKK